VEGEELRLSGWEEEHEEEEEEHEEEK